MLSEMAGLSLKIISGSREEEIHSTNWVRVREKNLGSCLHCVLRDFESCHSIGPKTCVAEHGLMSADEVGLFVSSVFYNL